MTYPRICVYDLPKSVLIWLYFVTFFRIKIKRDPVRNEGFAVLFLTPLISVGFRYRDVDISSYRLVTGVFVDWLPGKWFTDPTNGVRCLRHRLHHDWYTHEVPERLKRSI